MARTTPLVILVLVAMSGCYDSRSVDDRRDAGRSAPLHDANVAESDGAMPPPDPGPPPPPTDQLDLLFVIDNSNSMAEEQASLATELPGLLGTLSSRFTSIQVGVVTADMGVGGHDVPTCVNRDFGDDGILRTAGRTDIAGCSATYPRFLVWQAGGGQPIDAFASDVGCVARAGVGGCGFEQQLEAPLKALTPTAPRVWTSTQFHVVGTPGAPDGLDRPFFRMTSPHGNVANDGFVRDDSMLAVVLVTDEEDCSASDPNVFDPASTTYGSADLNLRCFAYPQALHPVSRYVRGLLQLRRHPSRLAYFVLAGLPPDLAPSPGAQIAWNRLISPDPAVRDARMNERVDPTQPNRLTPSCSTENGVAFPPIRILQTAQQLESAGARVGIGSICQDSYATAFASFLTVLAR